MLRKSIILACAAAMLAGLWLFLQPQKTELDDSAGKLSYYLSVTNGVVAGPAVLVAREGYALELVVESDQDDLLHLHGYELQRPIVAEQTLTLVFDATLPGRYLLELENSGIPLASLEVYPR